MGSQSASERNVPFLNGILEVSFLPGGGSGGRDWMLGVGRAEETGRKGSTQGCIESRYQERRNAKGIWRLVSSIFITPKLIGCPNSKRFVWGKLLPRWQLSRLKSYRLTIVLFPAMCPGYSFDNDSVIGGIMPFHREYKYMWYEVKNIPNTFKENRLLFSIF